MRVRLRIEAQQDPGGPATATIYGEGEHFGLVRGEPSNTIPEAINSALGRALEEIHTATPIFPVHGTEEEVAAVAASPGPPIDLQQQPWGGRWANRRPGSPR